MHSPFTGLNEDLMRADRKAERMGTVAALIAAAIMVASVVALKYAIDLHHALQVLFSIAGAE